MPAPPDPTWIAGFWDNGDQDDLVASIASAVDMNLVVASPAPVVASVATLEPASFGARTLSAAASRAPPVHA